MKWNQDKSVKLTRVCIFIFWVILAGVCIGAPWIYGAFAKLRSPQLDGKVTYLLVTHYSTAIPVATALFVMQKLLANISKNEVFIPENIAYLRVLSFCCLVAGIIFFVSGFYYLSFLFLGVIALFAALLLRVIKNVFAEAEEIKQENDYTI